MAAGQGSGKSGLRDAVRSGRPPPGPPLQPPRPAQVVTPTTAEARLRRGVCASPPETETAPQLSGARTPRRGTARARSRLPLSARPLLASSCPRPPPLPSGSLPPPSQGLGSRGANGTGPAAECGRRVGRGRQAELFRPWSRRREEVRRGRPPRGRRAYGRRGAAGRAGGIGAGGESEEGRCGGRARDGMRADPGRRARAGSGCRSLPGLRGCPGWRPEPAGGVGAPHLGGGGGDWRSPPVARPWQRPPLPPLRGARCGARSPSSPGGVWLGCCLTHTLASVRDRVSPSRSWVSARYFALLLRLMLLV